MNKWYKVDEKISKVEKLDEDPMKFEKQWMDSWVQCNNCGQIRSVVQQICECELNEG